MDLESEINAFIHSFINPFTANPVKALHFAITHHFKFLTFERSGAQNWAPDRRNVKN